MIKSKLKLCAMFLTAIFALQATILLASAAETGRVVLETAVQTGDRLTLTLTFYQVEFNVFQFAVRFDPSVLQPIDAETGKETSNFSGFATYGKDTKWMATIGTAVDAEKGFFKFAGYVAPGASSNQVNEGGNVAAGSSGIQTFVFHFRKKTDAEPKFWLATEAGGEPYDHSLPGGAGLALGGQDVPAGIEFTYPAGAGKDESVDMPTMGSGSSGGTSMTREQRMKDTVIFQIGNASAAVSGKLTPIYPEEPTVTAYAHDNRTFVPVRFLAEHLGATVGWDGSSQTVIIQKNGRTIHMPVGQTTYTVDGKEKILDVPAEYKGEPGSPNQRTMVPLRFAAEALDMDVKWDALNKAVIVSPKSTPWNLDGTLEKQLMSDVLFMLSPLVQGMVGQGGVQ